MEKPPETTASILDAALDYDRFGLRIVPFVGKRPAVTDPLSFVATRVNMRFYFGSRGCNVALLTGDYVAWDTDNDQAEAWFWKNISVESPMRVRSGGGGTHRYYDGRGLDIRNKQGFAGVRGNDLRGRGGFALLPPSIHPETGKRYEFLTELLPLDALPRFNPAWLKPPRLESRGLRQIARPRSITRRPIEEVRKSIRRTYAIAGHGGHNATHAVTMELYEAGLSFDEVLAELEAWNETNAVPLWSTRELVHKARSGSEKVFGRNGSREP